MCPGPCVLGASCHLAGEAPGTGPTGCGPREADRSFACSGLCLSLLLGVPGPAGEAPARWPGLGVGGGVRSTELTVEVEDRGFLQVESGHVL